MIGFGGLAANARKLIEQRARMVMTPPGSEPLLYANSVAEERDSIAAERSYLRQIQSGINSKVQLAPLLQARAHESSAIEHDPHRLISFRAMHLRDWLAASSCRCPADVAGLVTIPEFPQVLEVFTLALLPQATALKLDASAAQQEQLVPLGGLQARINADNRSKICLHPALRQPKPCLASQIRRAKLAISTLARFDLVLGSGLPSRSDGYR